MQNAQTGHASASTEIAADRNKSSGRRKVWKPPSSGGGGRSQKCFHNLLAIVQEFFDLFYGPTL
ncbi:MAG TPA: hypothetical protein VED17_04175, partial [Nitrososphaerales archaeon]|nr:hypothetical protein [Nitrososphaerales archaeon]